MEFKLADPEFKQLEEAEVNELLNQSIYLRLAMINSRDGTPLVHPIWYYYENGKFFAVSNKDGTIWSQEAWSKWYITDKFCEEDNGIKIYIRVCTSWPYVFSQSNSHYTNPNFWYHNNNYFSNASSK